MTREELTRLAEQAGFEIEQPSDGHNVSGDNACLERFAFLIAAAEREECAQACDAWSKRHDDVGGYCAAAIRARGKNDRHG